MCGIAGIIDPTGTAHAVNVFRVNAMLTKIAYRGPDGEGTWAEDSVTLGHRRLAVLDLTNAGHQPMASACGRFVIVFNGEIYNHLDLRLSLNTNINWNGHTDTETLLCCIAEFGIEATLKSAVGMFAFVLYDRQKKILTLARDRAGEKPLYYGWQNGVFLFGSELKALRVHPMFQGETDWGVATTFLRLNYIPAPATIYKNVFKLRPGTTLRLTSADVLRKSLPDSRPYWSLDEAASNGLQNSFNGTFNDAVDALDALIRRSVKLQSVADVPVGAFLSGGIDSSTVVAMMASATTSNVMTFAIGMPDPKMDESRHAAAVAAHLGVNHTQHIIQPHEALQLIPKLNDIWDEPFADSSQIPTYLVSKLAKEKVTVALSGDGGDEFFLGYPKYLLYEKLWRLRFLGKLNWRAAIGVLEKFSKNEHFADSLQRAKSVTRAWQKPDVTAFCRYWEDRYRLGGLPLTQESAICSSIASIFLDPKEASGHYDAGQYLPDDILVKVDRAAMANSLETRAPLLDHRIIEFAYSLPLEYKLSGGIGKKVLREVLYRYVPKEIVDRPKMGFSIPLDTWLRTDLRDWGEEQIRRIPNDHFHIKKQQILKTWNDHLNGKVRTEQLWGIFSLLAFVKI